MPKIQGYYVQYMLQTQIPLMENARHDECHQEKKDDFERQL